MAGMLPGVEAARRRRIYQGRGGIGSNQPSIGLLSSPSSHSRRSCSSFSLFSSSSNSASSLQRSKTKQIDEKLGQLAREAKERLDERLRAQTKSAIKRNNSDVRSERMDRRRRGEREMRTEVYGTKKKKLIGLGLGLGLGLGWGKQQMGWETWEQEECAVCLEEFKVGENVVNLPCAHTFHSRCLVPWLHTSSHCPCCRISIFS